jgi:hypothetical protein
MVYGERYTILTALIPRIATKRQGKRVCYLDSNNGEKTVEFKSASREKAANGCRCGSGHHRGSHFLVKREYQSAATIAPSGLSCFMAAALDLPGPSL